MDYKQQLVTSSAQKIDVHHHLVPDFWLEAVNAAGLDPAERPPPWTLEATEVVMNDLGITTTMLSLTTPGACIVQGQASRDMARRANEYAAEIRDEKPSKFGFLASLPSLLDTTGAIEEIKYAFEKLKPDGVIVFTRYGDKNCYLGDARLRPVWAELNEHKAVVLIHPATPEGFKSPMPATLLLNITEFPHETTRTAVDLIFSNTKRDYPDIKFILSHAGGTIPYLIGRISLMELLPYAPIHKTKNEIIAEAKTFYFDTALSGTGKSDGSGEVEVDQGKGLRRG
ncbi:decarboxylase [Hyphodiscus hymeniophilus]|uniref:6-methylsalicylate decarboxylase n=1 Tax=Hyphodiscus hymeniophilus TaxID=353542 RepID=A0A9P6VRJ3_9HELO|nr:decarboxylase [Hyphodiscus hymeniophilus]